MLLVRNIKIKYKQWILKDALFLIWRITMAQNTAVAVVGRLGCV